MKTRRRSIFKLFLIALVSILAGLGATGSQPQASTAPDGPASNSISGYGCVTQGVEAGCLMVTDKKTGTVYNVYFRGTKKPPIGTAIRFTGTPHDGPTTCMQGRAVNVRTWVQLKMKCSTETGDSGGC